MRDGDMGKKPVLTARVDAKTIERLDRWIAKQDVPPTRTAVIEAAINEFLDRRERKGKK